MFLLIYYFEKLIGLQNGIILLFGTQIYQINILIFFMNYFLSYLSCWNISNIYNLGNYVLNKIIYFVIVIKKNNYWITK